MAPDRRTEAISKVQPIIQAAEQAATGIIEDAEERARQYVEESRRRADELAEERARDLWTLTDDLIGRAEAVKHQSDELLTALNRTRRGAAAALQAGAPAAEPAPQPPTPETAEPPRTPFAPAATPDRLEFQREPPVAVPPPPIAAPEAVADPAETPPPAAQMPPTDEAKLLATQMAVAGGDRSEIANRLVEEFGVEDPESVLDEILGPAR